MYEYPIVAEMTSERGRERAMLHKCVACNKGVYGPLFQSRCNRTVWRKSCQVLLTSVWDQLWELLSLFVANMYSGCTILPLGNFHLCRVACDLRRELQGSRSAGSILHLCLSSTTATACNQVGKFGVWHLLVILCKCQCVVRLKPSAHSSVHVTHIFARDALFLPQSLKFDSHLSTVYLSQLLNRSLLDCSRLGR